MVLTTTPLNDSQTFTSNWYDTVLRGHQRSAMTFALKTDTDCEVYVDFSMDQSNVDSSLPYLVDANINEVHRLTITRRYYRIRVVNNSGSNQTFLRLVSSMGDFGPLTSPYNTVIQNDADTIITRALNDTLDMARGKLQNFTIIDKFGYNNDISNSGNEDVINGGGLYAGFPSSAEEFQIVLSNGDDVGADVTFQYIESFTSTEIKTATITTTGTTTNTGITGIRSSRGVFKDSTAGNLGTVTLRHRTTTTNVFWIIGIGHGQTRIAVFSVPAGHIALFERVKVEVNKSATSVITGYYYLIRYNESPVQYRPYVATQNQAELDEPKRGFVINGFADIAVRVDTCSANSTGVFAKMSGVLIKI